MQKACGVTLNSSQNYPWSPNCDTVQAASSAISKWKSTELSQANVHRLIPRSASSLSTKLDTHAFKQPLNKVQLKDLKRKNFSDQTVKKNPVGS